MTADILQKLARESPIADAAYLLEPRLAAPVVPPAAETGEYILQVNGKKNMDAVAVATLLTPGLRARLNQPLLRGLTPQGGWTPFVPERMPHDAAFSRLQLTWELSRFAEDTLSETMRSAARHEQRLREAAAPFGLFVTSNMTPAEAGERAVARMTNVSRVARVIEMRLFPAGSLFAARDVWRAAYALGLVWREDAELFAWRDAKDTMNLWTLSAPSSPGSLLPERAIQGSGVAMLSLSFEPVTVADSLGVYDRMAIALSYLRQTLGGIPKTPDGAILDAERLETDRDELQRGDIGLGTRPHI